ncbi:hypothetical protein CCB80_03920 [Armatimonadetes bacterium Uphvl-Ar1]|nr:hypothetical protein CCB80_03920 [Armatimonadetes bacterium Uphvl-Ar1]
MRKPDNPNTKGLSSEPGKPPDLKALSNLLTAASGFGAAALAYGHFVEANRLVAEQRTLTIPRWPASLAGYRIGFIADLHIRDQQTITLARAALSWLADQNPNILVIGGDLVDRNTPYYRHLLQFALQDLPHFAGKCLIIPGNRDHDRGDVNQVKSIVEDLGARFLLNQVHHQDGIEWVGIDSANGGTPAPYTTLEKSNPQNPIVILWHEPDMVEQLPIGPELMLAGHSHGGQFLTPWGWAPKKTSNGRKYIRGYYPNAPTPLYVTRGLATTFFPSRLFCPPKSQF